MDLQSHYKSFDSVKITISKVVDEVSSNTKEAYETMLGFSLDEVTHGFIERYINKRDLSVVNWKDMFITLATQIEHSAMGRFLINARGCNWQTTDMWFDEGYKNSLKELDSKGELPLIDELLIFRFPTMLATQERFKIFARLTQEALCSNIAIASLPCGRMRDLLALDFNSVSNVSICGLDKDTEALTGARSLADTFNLSEKSVPSIDFVEIDGLSSSVESYGLNKKFSIITSNGLNIYLTEAQCEVFYANIFSMLKPGGLFITSHIVPPDDWNMAGLDVLNLCLQKIFFAVIIKPLWSSFFKPVDVVKLQLEEQGFINVDIHYDSARSFPAFTARKPF